MCHWYAPILVLCLCMASCREPGVEDWRHGSGICEVHHTQMRTEQVRGLGALISFTKEYMNAMEQFPHPGIDYGPDLYSDEVGLIYICTDCEAGRDAWLAKEGT